MAQTEPQLKPCPFCGGRAKVCKVPDSDLYVAGCIDDYMCMGNVNHLAMVFFTPESAAAAWNKRPLAPGPGGGHGPRPAETAGRCSATVIELDLAKQAANAIRLQRALLDGTPWYK